MASSKVKNVENAVENDGILTLSSGVKVRLRTVSAYSLEMVKKTVKDPRPPVTVRDGVEEENPMHPDYLDSLREANEKRQQAVMEALLILGVELVDEIPPTDQWLEPMKYLNKRYGADIGDGYNLADPQDLDLLYKLLVAVGPNDWTDIGRGCGTMSEEDIQAEMTSFRGDETRGTDSSTGS